MSRRQRTRRPAAPHRISEAAVMSTGDLFRIALATDDSVPFDQLPAEILAEGTLDVLTPQQVVQTMVLLAMMGRVYALALPAGRRQELLAEFESIAVDAEFHKIKALFAAGGA